MQATYAIPSLSAALIRE